MPARAVRSPRTLRARSLLRNRSPVSTRPPGKDQYPFNGSRPRSTNRIESRAENQRTDTQQRILRIADGAILQPRLSRPRARDTPTLCAVTNSVAMSPSPKARFDGVSVIAISPSFFALRRISVDGFCRDPQVSFFIHANSVRHAGDLFDRAPALRAAPLPSNRKRERFARPNR